MTPLKAKVLIPISSRELDLPESECIQIVDLYYGELRHSLSELDYPSIWVDGLGKFYLKERYVNNIMNKYERIKKWALERRDSLKTRMILKAVLHQIDRMIRVLKLLEFTKTKRLLTREFKEWYVKNKHLKDTEDYKRIREDYKSRLDSYGKLTKDLEDFQIPSSNL